MRNPARNRLAFALALLLALATAELGLRLLGVPAPPAREIYFGDGWELGGFEEHPRRFVALAGGHRAEPHLAGRFATGAWPFRGRSPDPATNDTFRIAFLGDSCMYGFALDVRDTIPERVRAALIEAHGWSATDLEVVNLGTPAYSTHQLALLAEDELAGVQPDLVVVYPAAWNDQTPAMWKRDETIISGRGLRHLAGPFHSNVVGLVRERFEHWERGERLSRAEIFRRWNEGDAPYGTRIPEDELPGQLDWLLEACVEHAPTLVVPAAHPAAVPVALPRVERDADAVAAAGRRADLPVLDARDVLPIGPEKRWFIDRVHYNRLGSELLGSAIAAWIAEHHEAPETAGGSSAATIVAVEPSELSCFGGERLRIEFADGLVSQELPEVWVGSTPLLDVRALDANTIEGMTIADAAGEVEVLVRFANGKRARTSARRTLARLDPVPGEPGTFHFVSRPGDSAYVHAAERRKAVPTPMFEGDYCLDAPRGRTVLEVTAGDDGQARFTLPAPFAAADGFRHVQAIVVPAGEPVDTIEKRWSEVGTIEGGG